MKNQKDQDLHIKRKIASIDLNEASSQKILPSHLVKQTSLLALSLTATNSFATPAILIDTASESSANINIDKIVLPELMMIDSRLKNIDNLVERRRKGLIPIIVQQHENGLDAISQAMLNYPDAVTIHIVSHGEPGEILLGNTAIDEGQLNTKTGSINQWRNDKVLARPDLIVYGCNVAKGQAGQDFINKLSLVTGFDVAASTDLTGETGLGGDWELESNTGWIDASLAWQETDIKQIQGVLANYTVNSLADSGAGTLRDALENRVADGDTINFSVTGIITLNSGELTIANDITITGPGRASLSIDAAGTSRVMAINNSNVTISGVTITGGSASGNGGGIRSYYSDLTISDSAIENNFVSSNGGGISGYNSNLTISGSSISSNSVSEGSGGGVALRYSGATISSSTIATNNADYGGGLVLTYSGVTISNTTLSGNTARSGGGINSRYTFLNITNSGITNNRAYEGGGMALGANVTNINDTTISSNTATEGYGGGINSYSSGFTSLNIIRGSINNNRSDVSGGGINIVTNNRFQRPPASLKSSIDSVTVSGDPGYRYSSGFNLDGVTIDGNSASSYGGGINIVQNYSGVRDKIGNIPAGHYYGIYGSSIKNSTISNNNSEGNGGGVSLRTYTGNLELSNSTISGNTSDSQGGGIALTNFNGFNPPKKGRNYFTNLDIINTTVANNYAEGNAGGIYNSGYLSIQNSIVANNSSESGVNDFYNDNGVILDSSLIETLNGNSNNKGGNNVIDNGGNIFNTDPLLGPLQDNGGLTETHLLMAGSPAIDTGNNALVSNLHEQRGTEFARILNSTVDMGAIETGTTTTNAILYSLVVEETVGGITYTINLDNPAPAEGVTINLDFSGTANEGDDYTASGRQIVIPAGASSGSITFTIIEDGLEEPDETIIVEIVGIAEASVTGPTTATVTILASGVPAPAVIPTLSNWATILLSLLLPAFVMRRFRKHKKIEVTYS